ncbi:glycoside hydrolase family 130 protein [Nocardia sp. NBC_00565]|uniref:glycoside hydrolase family 130 protein n=1 Tax=Nocardia sp. NBC_00565 TaxID=2975993 RepID=UPI002E80A75A|nr:glycoside hydrolase family 130 protein [Nocardia sp. NBC_00565]WUC00976.1 glycoside hydrolase family 130 protein [Nocardia sp. NBC_00565]
MADLVRRSATVLLPDARRVLARLFLPGQEILGQGISRAEAIIDRVLALADADILAGLASVRTRFGDRHRDIDATFAEHAALVEHLLPRTATLTPERRQLIGAYFTQEYAVEAAALFNPSIVAHPDQSGLAAGELRFVMSMRALGEGHLSSIEFRTGVLAQHDSLRFDEPSPFLDIGRVAASTAGDYTVTFPADRPLSERVIFPQTSAESRGIEDARLTRFTEVDGAVTYYATYTAFDGAHIAPRLLRTNDFDTFVSARLAGSGAEDKGMALFPRRVDNRYLMLSRWDRESISVVSSADTRVWRAPVTVYRPTQPWELIQLGNCGPPIETPDGWLVLTHGVGPMRTYGIGAILLDLDDPTRLIGALREPLLTPIEDERDGYVPNVTYSCGALVHRNTLVLPYGCSDSAIRFAFIDLSALRRQLLA